MYQLNEDREFDDEEYCSSGARKVPDYEISSFEFSLHPNPATENCTGIIKTYNKDLRLELRTITGTLVKVLNIFKGTQSFNIDLTDLSEGLYFVGLYDGSKVLGVKKLSVINQ